MSQTAIELKPCPFCGGEDLNLRSDRHMSWVSCTSCGLEAPTETGVTGELAVQYWNSRAPHQPVTADWVMAPKEPTPAMLAAFDRCTDDNGSCLIKTGYRAMIEAAQVTT